MLTDDADRLNRAEPERVVRFVSRVAAFAIAWFALVRCVRFDTPVDRAIPFIGLVLLLVAYTSRAALAAALPVLASLALLVGDERARLTSYGLVVAVTFALAIAFADREGDLGVFRSVLLALFAVLLLRWIPVGEVLLLRELFLLALTGATVTILGGGPFAIAAGVVTAFFTPAIPLRTLILPLAVLALCAIARVLGAPRQRATFFSSAVTAAALLFFPWSGIVARALPVVVHGVPPPHARHHVHAALAPGRSVTLDVPPNATALIVSGANVPRMRRGDALGTLEPGGRRIVIGDAADWGALRREHFWNAKNPLPRDPAGSIHGYGYAAWIDGAGRIALPPGARTIVVTADRNLKSDASLQVEAFEVQP